MIGHEDIKGQINRSIDLGMFSHAHLIIGEDGIGKSIIARYAALKLLKKEKNRQYADIIEFRVEKGKKSIGVDAVRSIIVEINKKPFEGDKKVIIIFESDKMTEEAQNAFLKTVEEPPSGVYIILLSENEKNILDTIKSRCQIHKLEGLNDEEMQRFMKREFHNLKPEEFKTVINFSGGIPGRAEKLLDSASFKEMRNLMLQILVKASGNDEREILQYEALLTKNKNNWQEALTILLSFVRDIMVYKESQNEEIIINLDKINSIKQMTESFSFTKLSAIIDIVNETEKRLEHNVNTALAFDVMLLKMQEV